MNDTISMMGCLFQLYVKYYVSITQMNWEIYMAHNCVLSDLTAHEAMIIQTLIDNIEIS